MTGPGAAPLSRRDLVKLGVGAMAGALVPRPSRRWAADSAVVVGAGGFGAWTAWYLLQRGLRVTLVDAWGAVNGRASSGGESRIIRATYGAQRIHTQLTARALRLWVDYQRRWGRTLYVRTGSLRMKSVDDERFEQAAMPLLAEAGLTLERVPVDEAARRFPQVRFDGVRSVYVEREAGYLLARDACQELVRRLVQGGATYQTGWASPAEMSGGRATSLPVSGGGTLSADHYVFACGAWLREVLPEVVGDLIRPTRQEVFYFGTPAGDDRFSEDRMPVWVDSAERVFYGIPGNAGRGFKVADDTRGARFEPTTGDRTPSQEGAAAARAVLERRFPALRDAPLLEARVCQYENTPDGNFIIDRHPLASNLWIVGGGSGHGFKHGPALGELVAAMVLGEKPIEPLFSLGRF